VIAESSAKQQAQRQAKPEKEREDVEWAKALQRLESDITDKTAARSLHIFFPDMGAAALARRDWKMNSFEAQVPPCVECANIQNDCVEAEDVLVVLLCPLSYEAEAARRIQDQCDAMNKPCVMINSNLMNTDRGYGVRARDLRNTLINSFTTAYELKTMPQGAVVREWPAGFSV